MDSEAVVEALHVLEAAVAAPSRRSPKRKLSETTAKWHTRLRKERVPGQCGVRGCSNRSRTKRARWCKEHFEALKREQNRVNTANFRKRAARGKVGHRLVYAGRPTAYAKQLRRLRGK